MRAVAAEERAQAAEAKLSSYWEERARAAEARASAAEAALASAATLALPLPMDETRTMRKPAPGSQAALPTATVVNVADSTPPSSPSSRPSLIPVLSPKRVQISPTGSSPRVLVGGGERASAGARMGARVGTPGSTAGSTEGDVTPGRHSAQLLMGRCITELSRMVDELRVLPSEAGEVGYSLPLGGEAAVAARLAAGRRPQGTSEATERRRRRGLPHGK